MHHKVLTHKVVLDCRIGSFKFKVNSCGLFMGNARSRVLTKHASLLCGFIHLPSTINLHRVTYQPWRVIFRISTRNMKRKATDSNIESKAKRHKEPEADYCDVIPCEDAHGNVVWPASEQSIHRARGFLKEW